MQYKPSNALKGYLKSFQVAFSFAGRRIGTKFGAEQGSTDIVAGRLGG